MHKEQSDKRIGAIWCRGNTLCSKTPLSDVFSEAYQRRHNLEVQLIIRRQIHSGISSVSDGGYEIRAAVKAKWPHTNTHIHTHTHTRGSRIRVYMFSEAYYIRSMKANPLIRDTQKSRNPKSGTVTENTLSRNHVVSKYYFSEAPHGTWKYIPRKWNDDFISELFQKFVILKFVFSLFFFTLIYEFLEYYDSISRDRAALKYKIIPFRY